MNWYIGQDIVAIEDHQQGIFKKWEVFKIRGLRMCKCKCNHVEIDIGFSVKTLRCATCNTENVPNSGIWWLHEKRFAPLDNLVNMDEIKEVMEDTDLIPA